MRDGYSLIGDRSLLSDSSDLNRDYAGGRRGVGKGYAIPLQLNLPYEGPLEAKSNKTKL